MFYVFVELCPGGGTDTALTTRRLHGLYPPPPRLCGRHLVINGQRSFLGLINSRYLNKYCCFCCLRAKIVAVKVTNCQIRKVNPPHGRGNIFAHARYHSFTGHVQPGSHEHPGLKHCQRHRFLYSACSETVQRGASLVATWGQRGPLNRP